jgi:polar amino acid transport system substrate-binding protein
LALGQETLYLVTGDFAPFSGQHLPQGGMTTEITVAAFKAVGYHAHIDYQPWKRGYTNTRKHLYFGTFPYVEDKTRKKLFLFSKPLYTAESYFFVHKDFNRPFNNKEDLKGLRACLPIGYSPREIQSYLDDGLITVAIRPSNDAACFRAIEKGRVDLYALNNITGWKVIQKTYGQKDGFKIIGDSIMPAYYHIIVDKQYPNGAALLSAFHEGLAQLKSSGLYQDIISRHLGL